MSMLNLFKLGQHVAGSQYRSFARVCVCIYSNFLCLILF